MTMSTHRHSPRTIKLCAYCQIEASAVVASENDDPMPTCSSCATAMLEAPTAREYPLEEFFEPIIGGEERRVHSHDPPNEPVFELFDPDSDDGEDGPQVWISADDEHSSLDLRACR